MRSVVIVSLEVTVQNQLHLLNGLEPSAVASSLKCSSMACGAALDEAVGLRAFDPCGAVLDAVEPQEQVVGMAIGPTTELAAIFGQDGIGDRQLARIERSARRSFRHL